MRFAIALMAICWASIASAALETWPALYDVSGVASDDVLNVRAEPNAQSEIIGTLPHDARDIEVVHVDEDTWWALINIGERSGWVSLAFMQRQEQRWDGTPPPIQSCYGTEPGWGLTLDGDTATYTSIMGETFSEPVVRLQSSTYYSRFSLSGDRITAVYDERLCRDGMSDRAFGVRIEVILRGADGPVHHSGCCSILP